MGRLPIQQILTGPVLALKDFDFDFPEELVASEPLEPRDSARLMVLRRNQEGWEHRQFAELPLLLKAGDCLVLNRTKVFACRLLGCKASGGKVELLLIGEIEAGLWWVLGSGLKAGLALRFPGNLTAEIQGLSPEGEYLCRFGSRDVAGYLLVHGLAPLPRYILKRRSGGLPSSQEADRARYQTIYARDLGSIAAPTAGLHFTEGLLESLKARGIKTAFLTLHVGRGTFKPIKCEDTRGHRMLPEWYSLSPEEALIISRTQRHGGRVVAVGTTCTRTLETIVQTGEILPREGWTDLYICPGFRFRAIAGLLTNFHLPRSTPLMLAAAFLGRERLLATYREAFREHYRLYSYGDAMLIL
jgi:S-adenosylmethionine:tRNA ribosyltransferase-isomerase